MNGTLYAIGLLCLGFVFLIVGDYIAGVIEDVIVAIIFAFRDEDAAFVELEELIDRILKE